MSVTKSTRKPCQWRLYLLVVCNPLDKWLNYSRIAPYSPQRLNCPFCREPVERYVKVHTPPIIDLLEEYEKLKANGKQAITSCPQATQEVLQATANAERARAEAELLQLEVRQARQSVAKLKEKYEKQESILKAYRVSLEGYKFRAAGWRIKAWQANEHLRLWQDILDVQVSTRADAFSIMFRRLNYNSGGRWIRYRILG